MNISKDFINAVEEKDLLMVRIMLKDSMILDPTLAEYYALSDYAERHMNDLYDVHDGENLIEDMELWTKDYLDEQMVVVVNNFSKERVELLKRICKHLYNDRASKIEYERMNETNANCAINKRQIGTGIAAVGVATTAVGLAIAKPLVTGVGIAAIIAGGTLIFADK